MRLIRGKDWQIELLSWKFKKEYNTYIIIDYFPKGDLYTLRMIERKRIMTNEQIIYNKQLELLKCGKIGTTGRVINGQDAEGNAIQIEEPEPIHTYAGWREHGYQVKRGQKAIATFNIWKCAKKRKKEKENEENSEEKKEYMFLTKAFFFSQKQVEKIENGGDQ